MQIDGKTYNDKVILRYCKRMIYKRGSGSYLNTHENFRLELDEEDDIVLLRADGDGTKVVFDFPVTEILQHILNKKLKKVRNA